MYSDLVTVRPVPNSASPQDEAGPWEDPHTFHTKTRESQTVAVTVRLPQSSIRGIAKIVQSGKFPDLETNSDAIRDAIWRWLRWMSEVTADDSMKKTLEVQRSHWKLEGELSRLEQLTSTVDTAERILTEVPHGQETRRRVLTELSDLAMKVEDCDLRTRILELVSKHR